YFAPVDVRDPLSAILRRSVDIPSYIRHLHELSTERRGAILQKIGSTRKQRFRFVDPLLKPYIVLRALQEGRLEQQLVDSYFARQEAQSRTTRRLRQHARRVEEP